jgi:hypothetical protein
MQTDGNGALPEAVASIPDIDTARGWPVVIDWTVLRSSHRECYFSESRLSLRLRQLPTDKIRLHFRRPLVVGGSPQAARAIRAKISQQLSSSSWLEVQQLE